MKRLFFFFPIFFLLAGCVQNPAPSATPIPQPSAQLNFTQFVSTQQELDALQKSGPLSSEDRLLLEANAEFLSFQNETEALNNLEFDCGNSDLYQKNLDTLQSSINKGKSALPLIKDSSKKDGWTGFFASLQMQEDSYESDLGDLCPQGFGGNGTRSNP